MFMFNIPIDLNRFLILCLGMLYDLNLLFTKLFYWNDKYFNVKQITWTQ